MSAVHKNAFTMPVIRPEIISIRANGASLALRFGVTEAAIY